MERVRECAIGREIKRDWADRVQTNEAVEGEKRALTQAERVCDRER